MSRKLLSLILIICFLSSCSRTEDGQVLRMNLGTEPLTLDWNLANDSISFDVISNIMMGLTRFGEDAGGNIISVPGCAKSWEVNDDASGYLFHLDPECTWTDGQPVTAQHFVDSFRRLLDPKTAAPYAELLSMIDLEKTQALDDTNLKIILKFPAAYFIYLTSYGLTLPIRLDVIEKHGNNWTEPENIVTNGIFKLKHWQHEYKIVLERRVASEKVNTLKYFMIPEPASAFTLFQNKQLDWIDSRSIPLSEIKNLKPDDANIFRKEMLRNTYIGFNNQFGPFKDPNLRQAFSYAIDRQKLVKLIGKGDVPGSTWIPPSLSKYLNYDKLLDAFNREHGFRPSRQEYINGYFPDLAREKLKASQYQGQELELLVPNRDVSKTLAEILQSMWSEELGITVKVNTMEWKVFLQTLRDDPPDMFRLNWGADYPDPDTFAQLFTSNNQINYERFHNQHYDQLIAQAAAITDDKRRRQLYTKAEEILTLENTALAPLFVDKQTIIKQPWIKGLKLNAMDIVFLDQVFYMVE